MHTHFHGELIREALKAEERSMRWLAEKCGISKPTLYAYLAPNGNPPADFIARVCRIFPDIEPNALIVSDDAPTPTSAKGA